MRIVHLAKYYAPAVGGIETHVRQLALAQSTQGHDVTVVCINHAAASTHRENDFDVRLIRVGRIGTLARFDFCPAARQEVVAACATDADIIHLHVPNPTMLLTLASIRRGAPIVIGYHSDIVRQKTLGRFLRPFELAVFRRAARIIAASPTYAGGSSLLQRFDWKTETIPYGIDLEPFANPADDALAFADELRERYKRPLWLAVGRMVYYKGFNVAISALADMDGTLLLVGSGPLERDLRRQANDLGVSDRVVFLSRLSQSQLIGAYHAATAFLFPSNARSEAFGLVQVEAMASGCPVINANIPHSGVPWVSQHEVSGLTVPVNDAKSLATAATRLAGDEVLRTRLGASARRRADSFAHTEMNRQMTEVYAAVSVEIGSSSISAAPRRAR